MKKSLLLGTSKIAASASIIVQKKKNSFKILKDRNPKDKKSLSLISILLDCPSDATLALVDNKTLFL